MEESEDEGKKEKTTQFKAQDVNELDVFQNEILIGQEEKLTASVIEKDYQSETEKKLELLKSNFHDVVITEEVELNNEDYEKELEQVNKQLREEKNPDNISFCLRHHLILVSVQKIVLSTTEKEKSQLLSVLLSYQTKQSKSFAYLESQTDIYDAFRSQADIVLQKLEPIYVQIKNVNQEELLNEKIELLSTRLDLKYQQSKFFCFQGPRNEKIHLFAEVILLPKNLEVAHISLPKPLIDYNLENFKTFLSTDNYLQWYKKFFPKEGLSEKVSKHIPGELHSFITLNKELFDPQSNSSLNEHIYYQSNLKFESLFSLLENHEAFEEEFTRHLQGEFHLLTPPNRFLLMRVTQNFLNSMVHFHDLSSFQYSFKEVDFVQQLVDEFLQEKAYLDTELKRRFHCVALLSYLTLCNNNKEEKNLRLYFSKKYIPILFYQLLGNVSLKDHCIVELFVHDIMSVSAKKDYSLYKNYYHSFKSVLAAKFFMQKLYPLQNKPFLSKMVFIDDILMSAIQTLFFEFANETAFFQYQDFKKLVRFYFVCQNSELMAKIGEVLDLSLVVDSLLIVSVCSQLEEVEFPDHSQSREFLMGKLSLAFSELRRHKQRIFSDLKSLISKGFYLEEMEGILKLFE